jgi:hypothetical protein
MKILLILAALFITGCAGMQIKIAPPVHHCRPEPDNRGGCRR